MDEEVGKLWKDLGEGKEYDQMLYEKRVFVIHKIKTMWKMEPFRLKATMFNRVAEQNLTDVLSSTIERGKEKISSDWENIKNLKKGTES